MSENRTNYGFMNTNASANFEEETAERSHILKYNNTISGCSSSPYLNNGTYKCEKDCQDPKDNESNTITMDFSFASTSTNSPVRSLDDRLNIPTLNIADNHHNMKRVLVPRRSTLDIHYDDCSESDESASEAGSAGQKNRGMLFPSFEHTEDDEEGLKAQNSYSKEPLRKKLNRCISGDFTTSRNRSRNNGSTPERIDLNNEEQEEEELFISQSFSPKDGDNDFLVNLDHLTTPAKKTSHLKRASMDSSFMKPSTPNRKLFLPKRASLDSSSLLTPRQYHNRRSSNNHTPSTPRVSISSQHNANRRNTPILSPNPFSPAPIEALTIHSNQPSPRVDFLNGIENPNILMRGNVLNDPPFLPTTSRSSSPVSSAKKTSRTSTPFLRPKLITASLHNAFCSTEDSPTDVMSFPSLRNTMPPETPSKARSAIGRTPTKRSRFFSHDYSDDEDDDNELDEIADLQQTQEAISAMSKISRFDNDFKVIATIGTGSFGTVFQCMSKLDGCQYAVKAMKRKAKGIADKERMLKEVYALAALSDLPEQATFHIVRYHQAWMEDSRLYIQTELCTSTLLQEIRNSPRTFLEDEKQNFRLLREILLALDLLHRNNIVHLDIKPDNIFIKNNQFKLGDFGLASKNSAEDKDVEEGDSRYMSKELLSGDIQDLTKCDIFSLGATMYEVCLARSLPSSGEEWHEIRNGILQELPQTPLDLKHIIMDMLHPQPSRRPSAKELLTKRQLLSEEQKMLIIERNKAVQATLELELEKQKHFNLNIPNPKRRQLIRSRSLM